MVDAATPNLAPQRSRLRTALRLILGGASLVFVAYACLDLARRWDASALSIRWLPLVLSALPLMLGLLVLALGWKWLLERMIGRPVPSVPALALHAESQIARYTPGKVGMPLVRMAGAPQLGAPVGAIASSVVIELLPFLSVGGAVGFLCLWLGSAHAHGALALLGRWGVIGLVVCSVGTLALVILPRRFYPNSLLQLLRAPGDTPLIPAKVPLANLVYWLTWAVHGYLASYGVGAEPRAAFASSGLFVLAPIAGFLALITPAGVGVREAVVSVGLAPTLGPAPAVAAALVSRFASLLVDALGWAVGRALARGAAVAPGR